MRKPLSPLIANSKLLIVEDEKDLLDTMEELFQELGFEVEVASNGKEALAKIAISPPDLIVSDVAMPVMDGYDLLRALRSSQEGRRIPVILLTAKAAFDEKIQGLGLGANDYVTKPFDYEELLLRIQNILRLKASLEDQSQVEEEEFELEGSSFLQSMTQFIDHNMVGGRLELNIVANRFQMSESGLQKKIRRITGKSYSQYIREYRLERAKQLLQTHQYSIGEVAELVGFSTTSYFSESFRSFFGYVPSKLLS